MTKLTHLHAIEVLPFTNSKGVKKVKLKSHRFNQTLIISWDWEIDALREIAEDYLTEKGFDLVSFAGTKNSFIVMTSTFEPLKALSQ